LRNYDECQTVKYSKELNVWLSDYDPEKDKPFQVTLPDGRSWSIVSRKFYSLPDQWKILINRRYEIDFRQFQLLFKK
jgi:hypothetical protein